MRSAALLHENSELKRELDESRAEARDARTRDVMRIEKLAMTNTELQAQLKVRAYRCRVLVAAASARARAPLAGVPWLTTNDAVAPPPPPRARGAHRHRS